MLRIGFCSTWGSPCGIATYTAALSKALLEAKKEIQIVILAPRVDGSCGFPLIDLPYEFTWRPQMPAGYATIFLDVARKHQLQVIHFQHEDGLFPHDYPFIQTLAELKKAGVKTLVTFHTLRPYGGVLRTGFFDAVKSYADVVIAHTAAGEASLLLAQGTAKVLRIPHGTLYPAPAGDKEKGYDSLQLPKRLRQGQILALVFGFANSGKNILNTVHAFIEAHNRRLIKNTVLAISGLYSAETYMQHEVRAAIALSGLSDIIHQNENYTADCQVQDIFSVADFAVLNTQSNTLSASGQVHLCAAYGVPLAAANRPIYYDAIRAGAIPFAVEQQTPSNPSLEAINAIASLAMCPSLRESVKRCMQKYAEQTAWSKLADGYCSLYGDLTKQSTGTDLNGKCSGEVVQGRSTDPRQS